MNEKEHMKIRARELRKSSTEAELKLWNLLRNRKFHGFKFRRQHGFGGYVVDFVCMRRKLIIELDGDQHCEQIEYDEIRSDYLKSLGFKVIRFWNFQVFKDMDAVLEEVYNCLRDQCMFHPRYPHPGPLPEYQERGLKKKVIG